MNKKNTILQIMIILFVGVIGGVSIWFQAKRFCNIGYNIENTWIFYVYFILGYVFVASLGGKRANTNILVGCIVAIALMMIFGDLEYSVIDESAHIDYVNCIINTKKLPTMFQKEDVDILKQMSTISSVADSYRYEAVQTPLYYVILALLTGFTNNLYIRFMIMRVFGLCMLLLVYILVCKTLDMLCKYGYIKKNTNYEMLVVLIMFNPGTMIRFIHVSNECLAVLLATCILYMSFKLICEGYTRKKAIITVLLGVLLFYTKTTGVLIICALLLVQIYYKKWLDFWLSGGLYACSAVPWFIYCKNLYGSFTGMNQHINIVQPIVNPQNNPVGIITGVFRIFERKYFIPDEIIHNNDFLDFLNVLFGAVLIIVVLIYIVFSLKRVFDFIKNKLEFKYSAEEKREITIIISSAILFLNITMLAISAYSSRLDTLLGRYMYFTILPLLIILIEFVDNINFKREFFVLCMVFFTLSYLVTVIFTVNKIGYQKGLWGHTFTKTLSVTNCSYNDEGFVDTINVEADLALANDIKDCILTTESGVNFKIKEIKKGTTEIELILQYPVREDDINSGILAYIQTEFSRDRLTYDDSTFLIVDKNSVYEQSFYWNKGNVTGIKLLSSTLEKKHNGTVFVEVKNLNGEIIKKAELDARYLEDNEWDEIVFGNAGNLPKDEYILGISFSDDFEGNILLYGSGEDDYRMGDLTINNQDSLRDLNVMIEYY